MAAAAWPQILVEAALVATTPVQPGGVLILDDVTSGLLDTNTLAGGDTWTDLGGWARSGSIGRPASREQGPLYSYQPGTATVVLNNEDGRFDPDNLGGPYVAAGATELTAMRPIRITAIWGGTRYPLFAGYADSWDDDGINYAGNYAETTLAATDAQKVLNGLHLAALVSPVGGNEASGARVNRVLTAAGWYTGSGKRRVAAGDSIMQGTTFGDTPWNLMQLTADSEIGELYIGGDGALVYRNRHAILTETRSSTSQALFGDGPGELAYRSVTRARDDTTIANDVQATPAGSATMQEAFDNASIAKYLFARTYQRTDLLLTSDAETLSWAQWIVYVARNDEDRFEQLTIQPLRDPVNLWPQVLGREIGDRITVTRRPPGVATPVTRDCFIRGIGHAWDWSAGTWTTTWTLQDASRYGSFLTLDQATLGQLDANAIAY